MEVLSISDACRNYDPMRASLGRLIEVVGTPRFEDEIFAAARGAFNCEHISALSVADAASPRILMSATNGSMSIPHDVAEKYVIRYWDLDPANRTPSSVARNQSFGLRIVAEEDITDEHYRHECYTAYRLIERVSIVRRSETNLYRLNFYAGGRYGRFVDSDINHIMGSADLLLALLVKHDATGFEMNEERTAASFRARLRLVSPKMPQREAEVCTAIMLGMTSDAIALKLGISVNTVLTYRKRAYGRLNISCQNELMRLILC
jgi:LuxR family transcriptional regulator, activator of tox operons